MITPSPWIPTGPHLVGVAYPYKTCRPSRQRPRRAPTPARRRWPNLRSSLTTTSRNNSRSNCRTSRTWRP